METDFNTARRVLRDPNVPPFMKSYYRAIVDGNLSDYYLEKLKEKRALPDGVDNTYDSSNFERAKCRGNIIIGISLDLRCVIESRVITNQFVIRMVELYNTRDWNFEKAPKDSIQSLTSQEEIEIINLTLDAAIKNIERNLQKGKA